MRSIQQFYDVFPHEQLLVLVRDGRDLLQSTLKTWPQLRFRRWPNDMTVRPGWLQAAMNCLVSAKQVIGGPVLRMRWRPTFSRVQLAYALD